MRFLTVFLLLVLLGLDAFAQTSDAALRQAMEADRLAKDSTGRLPALTAAEHLARAEAYSANRLFKEAREHWKSVLERFPEDPGIPKALFGTARSFMWEREYASAVEWFEKLIKDHIDTKDGREGLAFMGASYVRMGRNLEAAKTYQRYIDMFPKGERAESAHLNIIDAYREAGQYDNAIAWVERTADAFSGKASATNARHAQLRLEIYRGRWTEAVAAADRLLAGATFTGSMASADEVRYLRALALEKSGRSADAAAAFEILAANQSYYGGLARERGGDRVKLVANVRPARSVDHPVRFKAEVLRAASRYDVDPRFLLSIMKQESSFQPNAKSPAGARGLMQLVYDTAVKYNKGAGISSLHPDELYDPAKNIMVGTAYIADLKKEFGGLYEAIAASYNGGEDNALRWLNRTKPKDPGIFAAEVGFAETKNYVFKIMNNFRVYRELYNEKLEPR
jgi:soluble lytic murein transglycosylase